jgi:tyrosine-protein kinase Etk/Wzc
VKLNSTKDKQEDNKLDIKGLLLKYLKYWPLFIISSLIAYASAYLIIRYSEPLYKVNALIMIKDAGGTESSFLSELRLFKENKKLANEIAIIGSYDMVFSSLKQLDFNVSYFHEGNVRTTELYQNLPYKVLPDTGSKKQPFNTPIYIEILTETEYLLKINQKIIGKFNFGKPIHFNRLNFTILRDSRIPFERPPDKLFFIINYMPSYVNAYRGKLSVSKYYKESTLLELSSSGSIIQKEVDFINKLVDVYIQTGLDEKNQVAKNTISFIDDQIAGISISLTDAENELEVFQKRNRIISLDFTTNAVLGKLDKLEAEKAVLLVKAKYYAYIQNYIKINKENVNEIIAPSAMGIDDPLLNSLIGDLSRLYTEKAAISKSTTQKNPYLNVIEQKIKNTKEALEENLRNIIATSNLAINDVNNRIQETEGKISSLPRTERKLIDIQRKFNLNNHIYNYLLEKKAEAGIALASNLADNKIVDRARAINAIKISPQKNKIYTISAILGIGIPIIIIVLVNILNTKIVSQDQIRSHTDIPILGIIGHVADNSNLTVIDKPKSSIAEAFRSIRINLQYLSPEKTHKIISITSSISGEGKTFSSINLAGIIALSGKKTLLVGADMRKPKIYNDFKLSNDKGLSTYLAGVSQIEEITYSSGIENLDIIPSGPPPPNPSELLGLVRMDSLIEELRKSYDFIIMDTPPLGLVSDAFQLMKYSDINLYIVRHRYTEISMLEKVNNLYQEDKIKNMSILINDLLLKDARYNYGYKYGYGYYNSYGYYEEERKDKFRFLKKILKRFKKE